MDLVYPAEYRDYRDHQFFLLSILVGMGTGNSDWNLVCTLEKKGVGRAEAADSSESFQRGVAGATDGGAGRIFDGTGGDGMQERDGTAFWEWG